MSTTTNGEHMSPDAAARQALRVALAEVLVVAENLPPRLLRRESRPVVIV